MSLATLPLASLATIGEHSFDTIIDVRSPSEFAEDHLPGAMNLPVLDDAERARVGTIYKQQSPFLARKIGAALVARNAASHIEGPLADQGGGWRPLVYCWRGGQRSGSFATILSQVGWRTTLVEGGYKAWRTLVVRALTETPVSAPFVVLDGNTGTAKTAILNRLATLGHQVIDLEALANHRGSLFGHRPGGQPSQKAFEGRLAMALMALDPARPVLVEAESSRIGDLALPKVLWQAMGAAPRLVLTVPLSERAGYLARAYGDLTDDPVRLAAIVESLRPVHPAERIADWLALAETGAFARLAQGLMENHYDRRYEKHRARFARPGDEEISAERLDDAGLDRIAEGIAARLAVRFP